MHQVDEVTAPYAEASPRSVPARLSLVATWDLRGLAALAAAFAIALVPRLFDLGRPGDNYDEGVYLQSLLLMRHGYQPFAEIVATQGPLHLYLAYPSYALGGYTLAAARAGSVLSSLLAIGAVAWIGYVVGGRVAGVAAAVVLALSPAYLLVSREALPEAPATALAALAVGSAAWARRTEGNRWRLAAGLFLGLACLVKPVVAPAALAVFWLALSRRSLRVSLAAPTAAAVVGLIGLVAVGPAAVEQVIGWRLDGRQFDFSWSTISEGFAVLEDKMFRQEQPALYALAAIGGLVLAKRAGALPVVAWLVAQLLLLLCYVNLTSHLATTLLPPLAILAGGAVAAGWAAVARLRRPGLLAALAAGATLLYAVSLPALLDRDRRLVGGELSGHRAIGASDEQAVRIIAELTDEDGWVITDAPHLAFLADRKVPPPLVDPSAARIRSGALTASGAISVLREYRPDTVVLWTGKLSRLGPFVATLKRDLVHVRELGTGSNEVPRMIYRDRDARGR